MKRDSTTISWKFRLDTIYNAYRLRESPHKGLRYLPRVPENSLKFKDISAV